MNKFEKNVSQRIVSSKYLSYWAVLAMDLVLSALSAYASFMIMRYFAAQVISGHTILKVVGVSLIISLVCFYAFRTHRNIIRHSSLKSLWQIAAAVVTKDVLLFAFLFFSGWIASRYQISLGVILDMLLTFVLMTIARVAMLLGYDMVLTRLGRPKTRVLIYGATDKSVAAKTRLHNSRHYNIVGFIHYGKDLRSYLLAELPVYYFCDEKNFNAVIARNNIDAILFTTYNDAQREQNRLIHFCEKSDTPVKTLIAPPVDELNGNETAKSHVREVRIEDLLGRDEIKINTAEVLSAFSGKTVMVTGAAGSIGSELCRQMAQMGVSRLVLFDNAETPMHNLRLELENTCPSLCFVPFIGDVRAPQRLRFAFEKFRPDVVFHAAAYKHVPLMEENPCEAIMVNVGGTRNVADLCVEFGVDKMVMISTDKAVNPTNVMGASKRLAEIYVQSLGLAVESGKVSGHTKFVTTRFGNVLGSNGSVIPLFRRQIEMGGPLTVTHPDITRYFMTIPEACRLVMEAATMSKGNDIFVFEMGEPVKIADMARKMIVLAGYTPDVDIMIKYTGLRPGEKLYEEVLSTAENTIPTDHPKIKIAKVRRYDYSDIVPICERLSKLSEAVDVCATVTLMKETIPEYISNNSKEFERIDAQIEKQKEQQEQQEQPVKERQTA